MDFSIFNGFWVLKFGDQIWIFMYSYFGKFSGHFSKISNLLDFGFSNELKLDFT